MRGFGQPPLPLLENEKVVERVRAAEQQTLVRRYTEKAVEFIRANKDRPLLPLPARTRPSTSRFYPGKDFQGKSNNGIYGDWVEEVDWSVGQVLDTVRRLELGEKTLVISPPTTAARAAAVNPPLRGFKGSTLEGGMREPTVAWWPGTDPRRHGHRRNRRHDGHPAHLRQARRRQALPADRKLDGGDIWPLALGRPGANPARRLLLLPRAEARSRPQRAVEAPPGPRPNSTTSTPDIGESKNVAAANPRSSTGSASWPPPWKTTWAPTAWGPAAAPLGRVNDPRPLLSQDEDVPAGVSTP